MSIYVVARWVGLLSSFLALSACGGGASGNTTVTTSISQLQFTATSPDASTPAVQTFSAKFTPGTVYLAINHDGEAVTRADYVISGDTATITVYPNSPAILGSGIYTSTIVITGYQCGDANCTHLMPGNTDTVTATYTIPLDVRFVAPYVATANKSGSLILRGKGFNAFPVQDVQFGTTSASSFQVINDTEILASYPSLPANRYTVNVITPNTIAGPATTEATLVVQNPANYTATTIAYPTATSNLKRLLYDAERQTLLVARNATGTGMEIDGFVYSAGSWNNGPTTSISGLADIVLSINGQDLLSLSQSDITSLDPTTLSTISSTALPVLPSGDYYNHSVMVNNNIAVITSGYPGSSSTPLYLYSVTNNAFSQPAGIPGHPQGTPTLNNSVPGVSADGSLVVLDQGYPGSNNLPIYKFTSATQLFDLVTPSINQDTVLPALDPAATRIVLNGTNVYDASFNLLGTLPATTLAAAISPDAQRVYTYDSAAGGILSFDLSANVAGGAFPQLGSTTSLAGNPGTGVQMLISPDGGSLFIAGTTQIVVQPTPP